MQRQTAVTAYFTSKQLLLFAFALQSRISHGNTASRSADFIGFYSPGGLIVVWWWSTWFIIILHRGFLHYLDEGARNSCHLILPVAQPIYIRPVP